MPLLWNHFQEHAAALEPLPTLPTTLPDAHTEHPEHTAPAVDLSPPDTPHRPATDIFSLDSELMNDTYVSDNKDINDFTQDTICDEEVIFDYTNYEPQNYDEMMVTDCYRCDIIS